MPSFKNSGVYTMQNQGQLLASGQWCTDPYYKNTTILLQGDGVANATQNNTFLDSSTNNFTITRNGNTTQGSFTPYGPDWSNYFATDYLSISSAAADISGGAFTVECWAMRTATSGSYAQWIVGKRSTSGADSYVFSWYLAVNGSGKLSFIGSGVTPSSVTSPNTMTVGQWYHVAAVSDGTNVKLYENGVLVAGPTSLPITNYGYGGTIGNYPVDNPYFNGYISNLRIVKGSQVYTSNFVPSTTPLTAITNTALLTCQSNRFVDNSSNAYTLTPSGAPSVQRFSPFPPQYQYTPAVIGGSGYFDGSGDYLTMTADTAFRQDQGDWTLELWAYITSFSATNSLISMGQYFVADNMGVYVTTSGKLGYEAGSGGWSATANYETASGLIGLNAWTHIALVRSSGSLFMYINGVRQLNQASASFGSGSYNGLYIGDYYGQNTYPTSGYMSDVRFVKGTALYTNSTLTVPTAPLTAVANTSYLLSYTNAGIYDNAMMSDLETVGNAQVSTSVVKYGSGSMYFDGSSYLVGKSSNLYAFGTGDFTIESWIYPTSSSSYRAIFSSRGTNANSIWFGLDTGTMYPVLYTTVAVVTSSIAVPLNSWSHVALVRVNGITTIYVNGVSGGAAANTTDYTQTACAVGYDVGSPGYPWYGYLDEFRITKGVARYTANFQPPQVAFADQ